MGLHLRVLASKGKTPLPCRAAEAGRTDWGLYTRSRGRPLSKNDSHANSDSARATTHACKRIDCGALL